MENNISYNTQFTIASEAILSWKYLFLKLNFPRYGACISLHKNHDQTNRTNTVFFDNKSTYQSVWYSSVISQHADLTLWYNRLKYLFAFTIQECYRKSALKYFYTAIKINVLRELEFILKILENMIRNWSIESIT